MSTKKTPSTPVAQTVSQPTPTGKWRHPQLDEITRRQYATTFDEGNVRTITLNGLYFIGTFALVPAIRQIYFLAWLLGGLIRAFKSYPTFTFWTVTFIRLLFLYNVFVACLPILRRYMRKDELTDIPLTPSQRAALGLKTNVATPQTPGSAYQSPNYVTPPRYARSTPRNSLSNSGDRRLSESPLSGSPLGMGKSTSNSPFSPGANGASPYFQKALGGGSADRRRSFSRQSPVASSLFGDSSASNTPGTPTPAPAKASVGLNNKWLYEKGRGSPGRSLFS